MTSVTTFLVIGDPHFELKWLSTVDAFTRQVVNLVKSNKPDVVMILGDVLHTHEKARVECHKRAIEWFKELASYSHTVVLMGNHDRPNNSVYLTNDHFFTGLEGCPGLVIVATAPYSFEVSNGGESLRFVAVPYVPKGRLHETLDKLTVPFSEHRPTAVFSHQDIKGAKMGAIVCKDGDVWPENYPLLVNGHIHEYQTLGNNIIMPGTPYQTTYSEDMNKGVYLFTFTEGKQMPEIKRIKLNLRIKMSVNKTPSEFAAMKAPDLGSELRIIVQGEESEIEAVKVSKQYKEFSKLNNVNIVLVPILNTFALKSAALVTGGFYELMYKSITNDHPELTSLYEEILGDIQ
jgi:predicted phosphodiesterase